jgi:hypothetical protein
VSGVFSVFSFQLSVCGEWLTGRLVNWWTGG